MRYRWLIGLCDRALCDFIEIWLVPILAHFLSLRAAIVQGVMRDELEDPFGLITIYLRQEGL